MKHIKIYTRLIMFSCLPLLTQLASAQDELEKRQKALKETNEQLNRVYENNLPNKKGTTYSALTPQEIEASWNGRRTTSEKERYNAESGTRKTVYDDEKGDYVYVNSPASVFFESSETKMLETLMHRLAEQRHLYLSDKLAWYKDEYFAAGMPDHYKLKSLPYELASKAVQTFSETKQTATYQSLYDLVWQARILPMSARNMVLYLYEKFPDQRKSTELLELKQLPYFFGASRPFLNHRWADLEDYTNSPYPGCFYEYTNTPAGMRADLLQRFIELAAKYPEEGSIAAGFCRSHLIPFTLYAETNSNLTDAQKEDLYWKAIHIKRALPDRDYESSMGQTSYPFGGQDYVFLMFKKPLTWLIEHNEDRIKALTPEDWTEISNRTAARLAHIKNVRIYPRRKYMIDDIVLVRKYKNFKKAYEKQ